MRLFLVVLRSFWEASRIGMFAGEAKGVAVLFLFFWLGEVLGSKDVAREGARRGAHGGTERELFLWKVGSTNCNKLILILSCGKNRPTTAFSPLSEIER